MTRALGEGRLSGINDERIATVQAGKHDKRVNSANAALKLSHGGVFEVERRVGTGTTSIMCGPVAYRKDTLSATHENTCIVVRVDADQDQS